MAPINLRMLVPGQKANILKISALGELGRRIRDVAQGPDGAVYLLSDQPKGEIFRVTLEETAGQRPLPDLSPD